MERETHKWLAVKGYVDMLQVKIIFRVILFLN